MEFGHIKYIIFRLKKELTRTTMYGACADVTSCDLQSTVKQCDGLIGSLLHFLLTAFAVVYIGVANIAGWSRNGQADLVNCLLISV